MPITFRIVRFTAGIPNNLDKVYADKGYAGTPNKQFLADNYITDGIMRKNFTTAKLTELEM